jgi:hypothetical protein
MCGSICPIVELCGSIYPIVELCGSIYPIVELCVAVLRGIVHSFLMSYNTIQPITRKCAVWTIKYFTIMKRTYMSFHDLRGFKFFLANTTPIHVDCSVSKDGMNYVSYLPSYLCIRHVSSRTTFLLPVLLSPKITRVIRLDRRMNMRSDSSLSKCRVLE